MPVSDQAERLDRVEAVLAGALLLGPDATVFTYNLAEEQLLGLKRKQAIGFAGGERFVHIAMTYDASLERAMILVQATSEDT